MNGEQPRREPDADPLDGEGGKPVLIEDLETRRREAEAGKNRPSLPDINVDFGLAGLAFTALGCLLAVVFVCLMPQLPQPMAAWTGAFRALLLTGLFLTLGLASLTLAIRSQAGG